MRQKRLERAREKRVEDDILDVVLESASIERPLSELDDERMVDVGVPETGLLDLVDDVGAEGEGVGGSGTASGGGERKKK